MSNDAKVEGSTYLLSLVKITGKAIKDIHGYVTDPYDVAPTFKLIHVILEDDTSFYVEGEHDFPYLVDTDKYDLAQYMDE